MDGHFKKVLDMRIGRTAEALRKNNMDAHYIPDSGALLKKLDEIMPDASSCSVGGSMTLVETGVLDYLKSGRLKYYDRYAVGADITKVYHQALSADFYLILPQSYGY